ncbi:phosphatidylinositol glycan anchor biosynthesis class U protein-like [Schistocerca gregaria]|uniref:phosphatidylinositol glycan anchor biosynthesis class U protein-like n=1 Tax=Schistocerca gregaria TaxID=7010 RepID=UPI00211ECE01|nr:phosphatidylinositol glycan anchor biosynthesis class U protein-like [Schistocerca gregaria]
MYRPASLPLLHLTFIIALSIGFRYFIKNCYQNDWQSTYEVVTPVNSFKRLEEALWLKSKGIHPYDVGYYHDSPFYLCLFQQLSRLDSFQFLTSHIFIILDIFSVVLLFCLPNAYKRKFSHETSPETSLIHYAKHEKMTQSAANLDVSRSRLREFLQRQIYSHLPQIISLGYALNPFAVLSCVAKSTQTIENTAVFLLALLLLLNYKFLSTLLLALCIFVDPHLVVLIPPSCLLLTSDTNSNRYGFMTVVVSVVSFLQLWLILSFYFLNDGAKPISDISAVGWKFLQSYFGFIFKVEDIQPNIGINWYFFGLIFPNFRNFFLFVCQFQILFYMIPITLKFRKYPFVAWWILLCFSGLMKSYPSTADLATMFAFIPLIYHLLEKSDLMFVLHLFILICFFIIYVLRILFVHTVAINVNFYFFACLALRVLIFFLINDVMKAVLKRDFLVKYCYRELNETKSD